MQRREFLLSVSALAVPPSLARMRASSAEPDWKTFDITTHVHVQHASGRTRLWLPTPLAVAPYQKTLGDTFQLEGGSAAMVEREGIDLLLAEWPDGAEPVLTLVSRVATTAYAVDFATPSVAPPKDFLPFAPYLRTTKTPAFEDSATKAAEAGVMRKAGTDLDQARAIFEWVVGESGSNALFVALARAAGIPARLVHGLRLSATDATRAQVDRAEAYLVGYGWTPLDASERRFGSWDRRWIAFNAAQDVALPKATARDALPAFTHPHAETAGRRLDGLDADAFRYSITVVEVD